MQILHGKASIYFGNSDSTSHSIITRSDLESFVYRNRILTKLRHWKLRGPVIMNHRVEREFLQIEVLHCGNKNFRPFWLLWPWPWPNDFHIRMWPIFPGDILHVRKWTSYVHSFKSYHLTDIQTGPKLYTTPLCRWSKRERTQAHVSKLHMWINCDLLHMT